MIKGYLGYVKEMKRILLKKWKKRVEIIKKFKNRAMSGPSLNIYFQSFKLFREHQQKKRHNISIANMWNGTRLLKKYFRKVR